MPAGGDAASRPATSARLAAWTFARERPILSARGGCPAPRRSSSPGKNALRPEVHITLPPYAGATGAERLALRVMQLGAIAVVLAAVPFKLFELDRYFIPKELVLHATALIAGVLLLVGARRMALTAVDACLAGFLVLSAVSAALATNPWMAGRALGITLSSVVLFWCARRVARVGLYGPLLNALAFAVALGAFTCLLQTYGVQTDFFSLNRAPGGTFGNRNFVAHLCAFGLPVLVLCALRAKGAGGTLLSAVGLALVAAALVLSRSRAAWLAIAACAIALTPFVFLARGLFRDLRMAGRIFLLLLFVAGGVAGALLLPNSLHWKSDNPYAESAKGLVNYKEGSGAGRLVQYRNSANMALHHPLLGVGPGNWSVVYPRFAKASDPSMSDEAGVTSNPWPSSDWFAYLSERGPAALLLIAGAMLFMAGGAWRWLRNAEGPEEEMAALALAATLVAAVVVGVFDAVLLLPAPAFLVWTTLGALSAPARAEAKPVPVFVRVLGVLLVLAMGGALVLRSALQTVSMQIVDATGRTAEIERASAMDPGSYRIHMILAQKYSGRGQCKRLIPHADAARALFPEAGAPKHYRAQCGSGRATKRRRRRS
jgi:O-antigen ligase